MNTGNGHRPSEATSLTPDACPHSGQSLREQAEALDRSEPSPATHDVGVLSPEETLRTLHELRVHQIELEMQNEELRRAQAELDVARLRYFDLYDMAPVGYCTLNENGKIIEANFTAASLLGLDRGALARQPLTRFILKTDQDIYYLFQKQLFAEQRREPLVCEVRMVRKDKTSFWAHLVAIAAPQMNPGAAAGDGPLCRLALSDVTESKRAEEIITNYNTELEMRVAERTAVAENRARQLEILDRRLIRAEEAERQRIAHVLHEDVQQTLVAARMTLCSSLHKTGDELARKLENVDRMIQEALKLNRSLVHEMAPPGLREGGLLEAVEWLALQMHERSGFSVTVTADGPVAPLEDEVRICAYQAVRELLLNVAKHAKVSHAELTVKMLDAEKLLVAVRDDGIGFKVEGLKKPGDFDAGSGLTVIRERVEGFGGLMEIVSTVGQGTSVRLIFPTSRQAPN